MFGHNRKTVHKNVSGSGGVGLLVKEYLCNQFELNVVDDSYMTRYIKAKRIKSAFRDLHQAYKLKKDLFDKSCKRKKRAIST